MNKIRIQASKEYDVCIGAGLLRQLGSLVAGVCKARKTAIISDSHVWPLYGQTAKSSLEQAGFDVANYVFPAGESSKNGLTYLSILNFLAENRLTRTDCIIALGGGVVGDLAGFAAATYLRGIDYIQVPTTLLAAVDSSVGGKTAIDLPAGKNLAGCFYQPSLVICDIDTLTTLPAPVFRDGCAEVIKYGVLFDPALFVHLEHAGTAFDRKSVITRCVELKNAVVSEDEFDTGRRMLLNLGHTIGHGIEAGSNFSVSHGQAVAIGMAIVARGCGCADAGRIIGCLQRFGLPIKTDLSAQVLADAALSDKKRSADTIQLILPEAIGKCRIAPTPIDQLLSFIEAGL